MSPDFCDFGPEKPGKGPDFCEPVSVGTLNCYIGISKGKMYCFCEV